MSCNHQAQLRFVAYLAEIARFYELCRSFEHLPDSFQGSTIYERLQCQRHIDRIIRDRRAFQRTVKLNDKLLIEVQIVPILQKPIAHR
ncbi:hypothetical protein Pla8534_07420 [Lignipirellula cremea]|uniref:Uncharacterized protein n=1 Tax=Lignipirellula cremea TaxID=2528010 RepID=A0A518DMA4_9BACT|nr:hypothetical protein Pla8534_07420 [Lignipirellula cremea]